MEVEIVGFAETMVAAVERKDPPELEYRSVKHLSSMRDMGHETAPFHPRAGGVR